MDQKVLGTPFGNQPSSLNTEMDQKSQSEAALPVTKVSFPGMDLSPSPQVPLPSPTPDRTPDAMIAAQPSPGVPQAAPDQGMPEENSDFDSQVKQVLQKQNLISEEKEQVFGNIFRTRLSQKEVDIGIGDNGIFFRNNEKDKWKSMDSDPKMQEMWDYKMSRVRDTMDAPAEAAAAGGLALVSDGLRGRAITPMLKSMVDSGLIRGALGVLGESGVAGLSAYYTQLNQAGEWLAKKIHGDGVVDYFLKNNQKSPANSMGLKNALFAGAFSLGERGFSTAAQAYAERQVGAQMESKAAAQGGEIQGMAASEGVHLTPGMATAGVPGAEGIQGQEKQIYQTPGLWGLFTKRLEKTASELDSAIATTDKMLFDPKPSDQMTVGKHVNPSEVPTVERANVYDKALVGKQKAARFARGSIMTDVGNMTIADPTYALANYEATLKDRFPSLMDPKTGEISEARFEQFAHNSESKGSKDLLNNWRKLRDFYDSNPEHALNQAMHGSSRNETYGFDSSLPGGPSMNPLEQPNFQTNPAMRGHFQAGQPYNPQSSPGGPIGQPGMGAPQPVQPELPFSSRIFRSNDIMEYPDFLASQGLKDSALAKGLYSHYVGTSSAARSELSFGPVGARSKMLTVNDLITMSDSVSEASKFYKGERSSFERTSGEISHGLDEYKNEMVRKAYDKKVEMTDDPYWRQSGEENLAKLRDYRDSAASIRTLGNRVRQDLGQFAKLSVEGVDHDTFRKAVSSLEPKEQEELATLYYRELWNRAIERAPNGSVNVDPAALMRSEVKMGDNEKNIRYLMGDARFEKLDRLTKIGSQVAKFINSSAPMAAKESGLKAVTDLASEFTGHRRTLRDVVASVIPIPSGADASILEEKLEAMVNKANSRANAQAFKQSVAKRSGNAMTGLKYGLPAQRALKGLENQENE